jgi:hypothetical protein
MAVPGVSYSIMSQGVNPPGTPANVPRPLRQLEPNEEAFTFIASAANISKRVMATQQARQAMLQLAMTYDAFSKNGQLFHGNQEQAGAAVDIFLNKVLSIFPCIGIDEGLNNSNVLGYHPRQAWTGPANAFDTRNQWVFINNNVSPCTVDLFRSSVNDCFP